MKVERSLGGHAALGVLVLASSAGCFAGPSRRGNAAPASWSSGPSPKSFYTFVGGDPHRETKAPEITQADWTLAHERLAKMRAQVPSRPYVERLRVGIADPRTGKVYQARGAVAVSPERAARLVLVGPGGATALDLWVTRDRYRFSIPALSLLKRGGTDLTEARGLPVGLLRWWFLAPLEGRLVLARSTDEEAAFLFRNGGATIMVRTDGLGFVATRREPDGAATPHVEGILWSGRGLVPSAGARGRYVDGDLGMNVHVFVEDVLEDEPDPAAFFDPDDEGTKL